MTLRSTAALDGIGVGRRGYADMVVGAIRCLLPTQLEAAPTAGFAYAGSLGRYADAAGRGLRV